MRIGINALYLLPGKVGGSETYIRNLVKGLLDLGSRHTFIIFINEESRGLFLDTDPRVRIVQCPIRAINRPLRILWEQCILPLQVLRHKVDILFSPGMTTPLFCPVPSVLVIYDLQHVNQPRNFPPFQRFFLQRIIYLSAKAAAGIIAISLHVKNDIVKHYGIRPEKITVGYLGVDHQRYVPGAGSDESALRAKYSLPEHYIYYAAALLPHKNHERLFQAFKAIQKEFPGYKLVLTGAWEYGQETISTLISGLGLNRDVILLGWVPFEDVARLYRSAELFVYPTLHEGFGLPVLEAMASGTPVVCSHIEPLIEVSGGAALLVDPLVLSDIAQGMLSALKDSRVRQELIDKGLKRAAQFMWEKTAEETLNFIETIYTSHSGKSR